MFELFMARLSLLPYAFLWTPYIYMGKMLKISDSFSSEAAGRILLKFHVVTFQGGESERLLKGRGPMTTMAAMPINGKKKLVKIFSRTKLVLGPNFCTNH